MKDAADYLAYIKALIIANPYVVHWEVVREEDQGDIGLFRYKLKLRDGSLLEMFELFRIIEEGLQVVKYSFHWQAADGRLRRRWDNKGNYVLPPVPERRKVYRRSHKSVIKVLSESPFLYHLL